ncbi:MAG: CRTAC1 family protein [Pirellulaceae bacterium]|nr:CRTAC1 family protein [Pirellulaceae bacterium]
MASALVGVDPKQFELQPAFDNLIGDVSTLEIKPVLVDVKPLATPRLVNVAKQVGIDFQWYQDKQINIASIPIHESIGGGIAVIDFDLDGWPDVYFAQGSGEPPTDQCTRSNLLYRNLQGQFVDTTQTSDASDRNYGSGLAAGDVNQDGFTDLYLGSLGHNRLLINNGDGTFRDATSTLGDVADRFTSSLAIGDINGDALPDLYETVYIEMEGGFKLPEIAEDGTEIQPSPLLHYAQSDRWYENRGDGTYVMREIGREIAKPGTGLGVVITDFASDGNNEVFVGNDVRPNHFLVHTGNNQLSNAADAMGLANGYSGVANGCMGIATGDFNRDGEIDLHVTNFSLESANLYVQTKGGGFTDLAARYGIDQASWPMVGFGTKAVDIDRNGWLDLFVTNGHIFDMRKEGEGFQMPPQCLINRGVRFAATDVDDDSDYWNREYLGRAMTTIDYNRDGAIDLLIGHLDQPTALLKNETPTPGSWIQFELVGTQSERDAIGARVTVTSGDQTWTQWVTAGDGYFCSDESVLDFGLGVDQDTVDSVQIRWPSGEQQEFPLVKTTERYLVIEGESTLNNRLP